VIERDLQHFEAAITVGFSHTQIDPQVETLDDAAGVELVGLEVVHQQALVIAQRADELLHGSEFAPHGAGAPLLEEPTRPARTFVLPEGVEGFLECKGTHGLEIVFEQVAQFGGLPDGQVRPALEETIAGVSQHGLVAFGGELCGFLSPHLIDGLTEFFGDMEAVEHVERGGQHGGDDVQIGFPHVGADDLDSRAALRSEGLEEACEGLGVAVPDDAEKTLAPAVDLVNEGHVAVALAVGDFIDSDGGDVLQIAVFQAEIDDPFHRTADGVPVGPEAGGGFLPAHSPGP